MNARMPATGGDAGTAIEVARFQTFGFLVLRRFFDASLGLWPK
jgi:hypothetical protein